MDWYVYGDGIQEKSNAFRVGVVNPRTWGVYEGSGGDVTREHRVRSWNADLLTLFTDE